ncbi:glutathione S-transferase [Azorhizobium oxalatiphilum]|uniref:Glutathione S-transferase n=1 Tax=Azorhizobium oxalatiphilum TaxID=980631 RepID=A0A917BWK5_9HYPH|nr:glutathione S-transferase family protein [Azorhizobium oxalatiphilum]GGF57511.1 glutathione S-transferase [Azorhizobium oxalatiphilum]
MHPRPSHLPHVRLLGHPRSINVRKVRWTCDEIGLDYVQEDWGGNTRSTADAAFRVLSPKGLVPVLVDGPLVLTESNTIMRYLAAKHGRDDLLPADPIGRARVEEVMDWQATEFNAAWRPAFLSIVRGSPHAGTDEQVRASLNEWSRMLRLLEGRLADGRRHVCGGAFTLADIVIGLSVNRWFQTPMARPDMPLSRAYFARLMERPAARAYMGGDTD